MQQCRTIRRALLSVSNKTGLVDFARMLLSYDIELLSTGGTAKFLMEAGIPVKEVSDYTQFPEIMSGRVKTLHPKIYGGLLGRRDQDSVVMQQYHIEPIDMLIVNLYPFEEVTKAANCTLQDAIENIDIGGPAMLRAAAKNYFDVTVVTDVVDYQVILDQLYEYQGAITLSTRFSLAKKVFEYTARYDATIADYLNYLACDENSKVPPVIVDFPAILNLKFIKKHDLRYGENQHQKASFYVEEIASGSSIAKARQVQGKTLSYNNIADIDTALECVKEFDMPACVIVKHANPCGVAIGKSLLHAYQRAYNTDPTSAFGGIIAFNRELDVHTARTLIEQQFVEVIIAPAIHVAASDILAIKPNIRVLVCDEWQQSQASLDYKRVNGGLLVQESDAKSIIQNELQVVTQRVPTAQEWQDALFCWKVAKFVKSNAIVYARDQMTLGIGAGQMSRVYSAKIASIKAQYQGLNIAGAVMASDAFLPFRDGIDTAALAGVRCVIQPGGSIRDQEVITAADEHNIAMIFTGIRHFRH